jgi:hypothetical protein
MSDLEDLLVDEDDLNEEILVETLKPYLGIGDQTGSLIFEEKFDELNSEQKTLVSMLALKAMHELDIREEEKIGPTELADLTGISEGTIYPKVSGLEKDGLLEKDDNGRYWVPNHKIKRVQNQVKTDE